MLRSMYSAISGMQAFQTKLDVIGNNIANVNTYGFKAGRVNFNDLLSQTMTNGSSPLPQVSATGNPYLEGGTNTKQVGLGVKVGAIDTLFTQGADQTTGVTTDLAINGNGLFTITNDGGKTLLYTRAGDFTLDDANNLVLPDGEIAMGFDANSGLTGSGGPQNGTGNGYATAQGQLKEVNLNSMLNTYNQVYFPGTNHYSLTSSPDVGIAPDGGISVNVSDPAGNTSRITIGHIALSTFANPAGLEKAGDTAFIQSNNSGAPLYQTAGWNGSGSIMSGALEMSNVDLTNEFSEMIVAQRGFDANSKMIGTDNAVLNDIVNLKNG